ncbi:hypothetical protein BCIN_05g06580 [Botrytis cinerea B05.10]|uniref:DUF7918 domain-containing protein n=2 Tax=Botryotinia fuckeliana TaxID=40559 RepID=A0A384JIA5_BOTFB|nr:hypothetical protein BCIN_05g06580 [Botrytis cinerea B05.10]ATZ50290.1 hypothetical protein BCIN_05g06580 [Botrytis cinerea B05.10]CCD53412.1 hypothetical protein BofuT4_P134570.1 [Botrytis cinerea T4]
MAVLDKLPGLEFYFEVNGERLEEYDDDEEVEIKPGPVGKYQSSRTVAKYIEAVTGAAFGIKCHISSGFKMDSPNLFIKVYADGNYAEGKVAKYPYLESTLTFDGPLIFYPMSGGSAERYARQHYRFSELDISSDEARLSSLSKDKVKAEKVGTIEIKIWRGSESTPSRPSEYEYRAIPGKFHEKALKGQAKSHSVSYSPETIIPAQNYVQLTKLDGEDYPIAIYKFKYRSKESLKQLLIIERTPEPEESPTPDPAPDINLVSLSAAQKERLKAFLRNEGIAMGRASNTPERKIKRERDNGEGSSNQERRKRSRTTEIVDLTASSDEEA